MVSHCIFQASRRTPSLKLRVETMPFVPGARSNPIPATTEVRFLLNASCSCPLDSPETARAHWRAADCGDPLGFQWPCSSQKMPFSTDSACNWRVWHEYGTCKAACKMHQDAQKPWLCCLSSSPYLLVVFHVVKCAGKLRVSR